jgi:REP element-mobilizing transposase RayT
MENKVYYHRNLPHFQPLGGTFFITYSLAGSIPVDIIIKLQKEYEEEKLNLVIEDPDKSNLAQIRKRHFIKYDNILNKISSGPQFLKNELIAEIVASSLHYWEGKSLELICFCIMSNHVHLVLKLFNEKEKASPVYLHRILQSIKQFSAKRANKILGREGQFWQRESFDYQVRDRNELFRIISYILDNPVKAGLCQSRDQWKWSYIKEKYNEFM